MRSSSSSEAGLFSKPITAILSVPCPTKVATFSDGSTSIRTSRYCPMDSHCHSRPVLPRTGSTKVRSRSRFWGVKGAGVIPQFPTTSVVTPCCSLISLPGSSNTMRSEWQWPSMKPGATTRPPTSIFSSPLPCTLPTSTIWPSLIPTSPKYQGFPVPSTRRPFSITRSNTAIPLPDLPAGRYPLLLHTTLPNNVHLIVQIHRAADVVGDYLQRVPHFEVAVFVHREHSVFLREPLQHGIGVSFYVAVPLQVQRLRAGSYVGGERLAPAVDDDKIPGRSAHHRTNHDSCAFVERAGAEPGLHPVVEHVGSWPDLRHPVHLRHVLRRRSGTHTDFIHPYAPLPHLIRQRDHKLTLLQASLLELQRLRAAQNGATVRIDPREIQVPHGPDLLSQPDSLVIQNPGTPQP